MCCQNQLLRIWIPFLFLIALRFPFFVPNNSGMFNFNLGFRSGNCSCGTHSHLHLHLHLYSAIWNECFGVVLCVSKCIMLIAFVANENVESNIKQKFMKFVRTNASNVNALYILHILRVKFNLHFRFVSYSLILFFFLSLFHRHS